MPPDTQISPSQYEYISLFKLNFVQILGIEGYNMSNITNVAIQSVGAMHLNLI